jgi:3-oxoacyl-[acyl-carrier protein] reductase
MLMPVSFLFTSQRSHHSELANWRGTEKAQSVVDEIKQSGGSAIAVTGDVLDDAYIKTLIQKAADFGNGKIHIIVNNAGYTWDGVIHKMTDKQWHTIVDLHATAPFKIVRAAAPYFRVKDGEPRNIINISSTSGVNGNAGQINYALAKAGVTGMTKTIAKEYVYPFPHIPAC